MSARNRSAATPPRTTRAPKDAGARCDDRSLIARRSLPPSPVQLPGQELKRHVEVLLADDPEAALAHFWFVTIHPFDDGNGRIARAITDMVLARSENIPQRFYSMSAQIRRERAAYYDILERTQKGPIDITPWMDWFLGCLGRAIGGAQDILSGVLAKAGFWKRFQDVPVNDRQRLVLNRLLDGFEGKLTTSKYAKLAKCSQDTALRDILSLIESGMLVRNPGGGRSTSYSLPQTPADTLV